MPSVWLKEWYSIRKQKVKGLFVNCSQKQNYFLEQKNKETCLPTRKQKIGCFWKPPLIVLNCF